MGSVEITCLDQLIIAAASNERFASELFSDPAAALSDGPYACQLDEGDMSAVYAAVRDASDVQDLAQILCAYELY